MKATKLISAIEYARGEIDTTTLRNCGDPEALDALIMRVLRGCVHDFPVTKKSFSSTQNAAFHLMYRQQRTITTIC
ncbi:hypothetical protein KSX_42250 [Ktedonospora formicarum]|uniref:Uncharacterized protein n=1 Tax=Ktedonospora formicarum TaxID=2778364 RepID=A0A8J3MRH8_9CHLR|nr:hypothetical protein KSX_42250 [Ktedonospora formicarum]